MTQTRPWIPIFLAGCACVHVLVAQTGGGFGAPATGGTSGTTGSGQQAPRQQATEETEEEEEEKPKPGTRPGTGQPGTRPPGGTGQPGTTPPGGTAPPRDPFGFGEIIRPGSPFGAASDQGASTTFGSQPRNAEQPAEAESTPGGAEAPEAEAPSYTAPSFYGSARQVFTAGQGRFARPRYRYGASLGMGFDDNTQQTPDGQEDIPGQTIEQVIPAEPEIAVFQPQQELIGFRQQPRPGGGNVTVPVYRTVQKKIVLRPAVPEEVIVTEVPGVDFAERNASVVSRLDLNMDVQWANPRTIFTMDLRGGTEYYWSRDENPLEYNGSLALTYLRRLNPRMQFTGNASLVYQSQPDYSQVNLIDTAGADSGYFAGNIKLDLSYRWAARFSTVTSLSASSIIYGGNRESGSFWDATLGNEFRYIQSRRTTWVAELRYSQLHYLENVVGVIDTVFALIGADWTMSRKLRSTIRIGEAFRKFEDGGKATSPYAELSVVYQYDRRNNFSLSARHGFEQTASADDENIASRVSLGYTRTFNPRLVGSMNVNYVRNQLSNAAGAESTSEIYDAALMFNYMFSRKFSLNARYSYTLSQSSAGFSDYDRSRFFLTGRYDF